jgi:hypothetical protein
LDRSFDAANEAHGLGLVAAPERIDHRVHVEGRDRKLKVPCQTKHAISVSVH